MFNLVIDDYKVEYLKESDDVIAFDEDNLEECDLVNNIEDYAAHSASVNEDEAEVGEFVEEDGITDGTPDSLDDKEDIDDLADHTGTNADSWAVTEDEDLEEDDFEEDDEFLEDEDLEEDDEEFIGEDEEEFVEEDDFLEDDEFTEEELECIEDDFEEDEEF